MARFYESKEFREVEKHWNHILLETGFIDQEQLSRGERILKNDPGSHAYRLSAQSEIDSRLRYFETLSRLSRETIFPSLLEKIIMQMTADGKKIVDIQEHLLKNGRSLHRQTIRFIIRRYEHDWGLRFWTKKERNLRHDSK